MILHFNNSIFLRMLECVKLTRNKHCITTIAAMKHTHFEEKEIFPLNNILPTSLTFFFFGGGGFRLLQEIKLF